mmetsp:Transcript_22140/g.38032  ORF Transcript_22140/g.38032 Transcript_22140/m.38032 type:complete len:283 (-) Transcript_22140:595-1443(-)
MLIRELEQGSEQNRKAAVDHRLVRTHRPRRPALRHNAELGLVNVFSDVAPLLDQDSLRPVVLLRHQAQVLALLARLEVAAVHGERLLLVDLELVLQRLLKAAIVARDDNVLLRRVVRLLVRPLLPVRSFGVQEDGIGEHFLPSGHNVRSVARREHEHDVAHVSALQGARELLREVADSPVVQQGIHLAAVRAHLVDDDLTVALGIHSHDDQVRLVRMRHSVLVYLAEVVWHPNLHAEHAFVAVVAVRLLGVSDHFSDWTENKHPKGAVQFHQSMFVDGALVL